MNTSHRLLLLVNYISLGIMIPVMSLLLMERGCSLAQLAIVLGLYSLAVFVLELPSGIMADMLGRKTVFLLSVVFYCLTSLGMLLLSGFWAMATLAILWGAGRAFSSGSADALLIDEHIEKHGTEGLLRVTLELSLLETIGISIGSVLGGILPMLSGSLFKVLGKYSLNLLVRCALNALEAILVMLFLHETANRQTSDMKLKRHIAQSIQLVKGTVLLPLLAGVFCSGIFLFTVEAYWQPALRAMLSSDLLWIFGFLSFCCFCFAALGNLLAKRTMRQPQALNQKYTVFRLALFCALLFLAFQRSVVGFGIAYCAVYFAFGAANLYECTIINQETPAEMRASLLSLVSFSMQAGGMTAPILAGFVVSRYGIQMLWGAAGILFFFATVFIGRVLARMQKKCLGEPACTD